MRWTRAGWHHERTAWIMEIDLVAAAPLPEPAWPEGITVRSADLAQDARAVHAAEADSFSDHYGYVAQGFDEWFHFRTQFMTAEPELWILAMDGEEIAGMALCSSKRPGQPDLGWISTLGVRRAVASPRAGAGDPAPRLPAAGCAREAPSRAGRGFAVTDRRHAPL